MHLNVAKEFLQGSELTLENELYRVAAANAYYAMFWAAQAALRHDAHYKFQGVGVKETRRIVYHAGEFIKEVEAVTSK